MRHTEPCLPARYALHYLPRRIWSSLIHDLRQPVANLGASLACLELALNPPSRRAAEQLRVMELQVAEAARLLDSAAAELRALRSPRAAAGVER